MIYFVLAILLVLIIMALMRGFHLKQIAVMSFAIGTSFGVVATAGLIPWCIASSVPLATLGVGAAALPCSFFLWLLPLNRWMMSRKNIFMKERNKNGYN